MVDYDVRYFFFCDFLNGELVYRFMLNDCFYVFIWFSVGLIYNVMLKKVVFLFLRFFKIWK